MLAYVHQFLVALAFSATTEGLIVLALCVLFKKEKRIIWLAVLGTISTIPYVWFVFPTVFWFSSLASTAGGEVAAFMFEAGLYRVFGKLSWQYAFAFSLIANTASYVLGVFLLS